MVFGVWALDRAPGLRVKKTRVHGHTLSARLGLVELVLKSRGMLRFVKLHANHRCSYALDADSVRRGAGWALLGLADTLTGMPADISPAGRLCSPSRNS